MYPLIEIGIMEIMSWDLCLYLSYIVTTVLLIRNRPVDYPATRPQIFWGSLIFFFAGLLGAVLLHMLIHLDKFSGMPLDEALNSLGTAYLGAPILGLLFVWIYCREIKVSFLRAVDYIAPYLMLSRAFGRLGCLMEGCCRGIYSNLPWAQDFGEGAYRHPTQAYALIAALSIFIAGIKAYPRLKPYKGAMLFMVILLYGIMRFFNEFLRIDSPELIGQFHLSNLAMLVIIAIGITGLYLIYRKAEEKDRLLEGLKRMIVVFLISLLVITLIALPILSLLRIILQ